MKLLETLEESKEEKILKLIGKGVSNYGFPFKISGVLLYDLPFRLQPKNYILAVYCVFDNNSDFAVNTEYIRKYIKKYFGNNQIHIRVNFIRHEDTLRDNIQRIKNQILNRPSPMFDDLPTRIFYCSI